MTELELSLLKAERDAARASARQWKARAHLFRLRARDEKSAHAYTAELDLVFASKGTQP